MQKETAAAIPVEYEIPASSGPEGMERIVPLSILAYTEYADLTSEFPNTIESIRETYGRDFYLDNLTDYNDLNAMLPGHDILLIPEQEGPSVAQMQTVGAAWADTLDDFVWNGGIVILMDHWGSGIEVYNESGLMTITGPSSYTGGTIHSNPGGGGANALTRGLQGSWTAPDGSLVFDTASGRWAADDGAGHPHAVHNLYGEGHIVLLGFDMSNREINSDTLLANAVRLHRHVVYDASHSPFRSVYDEFSDFADDLLAEGYAVSSMNTFDSEILTAAEALIVAYCDVTYTAGEISSIRAFVEDGGGLWLIGDWGSWGNEIDAVANEFGYDLHDSAILHDSDECVREFEYWPFYDGANINDHSITVGVTRLEEFAGTGLVGMPAGAVWISRTDNDGTATWDGADPANSVPWIASSFLEAGRIAIVCDTSFLRDDTDSDEDGVINYYDSSHRTFALNTIRWLAAAGLRNDVVLFDESKDPYNSIHADLEFKTLADYLTTNGFTVRWMNTFSAAKIGNSDILAICDGGGSIAYSAGEVTTIRDFVDAGGGLFLVGDHGNFRINIDLIGNEFGLDLRDTGYLNETDDYEAYSSCIIYDGSNIGTHPVTTGVHCIVTNRATAFDSIGSGVALISSDNDNTCSWSTGEYANNVPVFAATEYGYGRVVTFTDVNFCADQHDFDGDGDTDFWESDNNLLTMNSFLWLVMNRAPTVAFTSPTGGEYLSGSVDVTWTAGDPDGDTLTFDLYYSPNDGADWYIIDTDMSGASYVWDTTLVSDGLDYWLGITVYDSETYELVVTDSSFVVDNTPPYVANLRHMPISPEVGETVTIYVDTSDMSGIADVLCAYSTDGGSTWDYLAMSYVSGNTYGVNIGSFAAETTVWYSAGSMDNAGWDTGWMTDQSFTIPSDTPTTTGDGFPLDPQTIMIIAIAGGAGVVVVIIIVILKRRGE